MNKAEPSACELVLTRLAFAFYGKSVYQDFADRLPIKCDDCVLDFGCGMGTVAYYVAKRVKQGQLVCADISQRWLRACKRTLRRFDNVLFQMLGAEHFALPDGFDVIYIHFVLHDIAEHELSRVIPALVSCLKYGGRLAFREPLAEADKLCLIKRLIEQNGMILQHSRVTDVPYMGNALESTYMKIERRTL